MSTFSHLAKSPAGNRLNSALAPRNIPQRLGFLIGDVEHWRALSAL